MCGLCRQRRSRPRGQQQQSAVCEIVHHIFFHGMCFIQTLRTISQPPWIQVQPVATSKSTSISVAIYLKAKRKRSTNMSKSRSMSVAIWPCCLHAYIECITPSSERVLLETNTHSSTDTAGCCWIVVTTSFPSLGWWWLDKYQGQSE